MMSKSSELDQKVKRYIIDCIDGTGYDVELKTTAEKIDFLRDCFEREYGHEIKRQGYVNALREWFAGLPSACTVAFYNGDILTLAVEWGSIPENATEKQEYKILENWFNLVAVKTDQLFRGYHVPK